VIFITLMKFEVGIIVSFWMDWGYTHSFFAWRRYFLTELVFWVGEDSLLFGGWSWLIVFLWFWMLFSCLCFMDHSLDIWMLATSSVIFFLKHLGDLMAPIDGFHAKLKCVVG
jgi:hypothetical protein